MESGDLINNRFTLEEQLGEGGFGFVWKALTNTDEAVALKFPHPDFEDFIFQEAETHKKLKHPNIRKILEIMPSAPSYLVMEYVQNTLRDEISKRNIEQSIKIIKQISKGLGYAHINNAVHGDIKPENILLDENLNIKICNFGLAKPLTDGFESTLKQSNLLTKTKKADALTILYAAPEQLEGKKPTQQSDIYSLNKIFYELLTGQRLGIGQHPHDGLKKAKINEQLTQIIKRALDYEPRKRFQTIDEFSSALQTIPYEVRTEEMMIHQNSFEKLVKEWDAEDEEEHYDDPIKAVVRQYRIDDEQYNKEDVEEDNNDLGEWETEDEKEENILKKYRVKERQYKEEKKQKEALQKQVKKHKKKELKKASKNKIKVKKPKPKKEIKVKESEIGKYKLRVEEHEALEKISKKYFKASPDYLLKNSILKLSKVSDYYRINSLDLSNLRLKKIPEEVTIFQHLENLNLNDNRLSEIQNLNNLTKLKILNLGENKIKEINGLEKLVKLEELNLNNNKIKSIDGLDYLRQLKKLDLSQNNICRIRDGSFNLYNLEELNLMKNKIKNIKGLKLLTNLKILNLESNKINKFEKLNDLYNIIELNLRHNQIPEIPATYIPKSLKKLDLSNNTIEGIDIHYLRNLEELIITNNLLSKEAKQKLKTLKKEGIKLPGILAENLTYRLGALGFLGAATIIILNLLGIPECVMKYYDRIKTTEKTPHYRTWEKTDDGKTGFFKTTDWEKTSRLSEIEKIAKENFDYNDLKSLEKLEWLKFDKSLEKLRQKNYDCHLKPWESFGIIIDQLEGKLQGKSEAIAKDMLKVGEWFDFFMERDQDKLYCYIPKTRLELEDIKWNANEALYYINKNKLKKDKEFYIKGLPSREWIDLSKFPEEFIKYIYTRKFEELPYQIKEGNSKAKINLPPEKELWPTARGLSLAKFHFFCSYLGASRGIRIHRK